jgi:hypothetical protein
VRVVDLKKPLATIHGRYLLESRIEAGELGSLWWAHDGASGRECVVCLVDIAKDGPDDPVPCSGREAMAFAQGECGQLVSMVEHGEWEGMTFFVLTLPQGEQDSSGQSRENIRATLPSESAQWGEQSGDLEPDPDGRVGSEECPARAGLADDPPSTFRAVVTGRGTLESVAEDEETAEASLALPHWRYAPKVAALSLALAAVAVMLVARFWSGDSTANQTPARLGRSSGKMVSATRPLPSASVRPLESAQPGPGSLSRPASPEKAPELGGERALLWTRSVPGRVGQPAEVMNRRVGASGAGLPRNLGTFRARPPPAASQQPASNPPWAGRLPPVPSIRAAVLEVPDYGI